MPLPHAHHVVLPANHLAQDQHDGDGGQTHEQEQWVGTLHHVQALFVAHYLQGINQTRRTESGLFRAYYLQGTDQTSHREPLFAASCLQGIKHTHISERVYTEWRSRGNRDSQYDDSQSWLWSHYRPHS